MTIPESEREQLAAFESAVAHARDYIEGIRSRRVFPDQHALTRLHEFETELSHGGLAPSQLIDQLHALASPATVASTGGRYFGLVVGGATPASMAASVLTSVWDQVAVLESSAPSVIHLERIASTWVLELLGLDESCSVGYTTGSSVANLVGLNAARNYQYSQLGYDLALSGLAGAPPLRVAVSQQAHVTVRKALATLGIGSSQLLELPCDKQGAVIAGEVPTLGPDTVLCLQAGNVNSGASDPFVEIIPRAKEQGAWVHVDGAFGLWAAASPSLRGQVAGVHLADSWAVDGHKWLNTPYDCGLAISKNSKAVHQVMRTQAPYLIQGEEAQPKDMVPEFSRRARGVEVWAALSELGRDGVADLVDRCCQFARQFAAGLEEIGYEILNDVVLNQVVASIGSESELKKIVAQVQQGGECWFGETTFQGRHAFRISVSSWVTTADDVERSLGAIAQATQTVLVNR